MPALIEGAVYGADGDEQQRIAITFDDASTHDDPVVELCTFTGGSRPKVVDRRHYRATAQMSAADLVRWLAREAGRIPGGELIETETRMTNVNTTTKPTATERLTSAYAAGTSDKQRQREKARAATFRPDPRMERLIEIEATSPDQLGTIDGATRMSLGTYRAARTAAGYGPDQGED